MKINIIGTGLFKSGGMKIIFEYANRLSAKGHDVVYYYPLKQYEFRKEKILMKVRKYYGAMKNHVINSDEVKKFYNAIFEIKAVPAISNNFIRNSDIVMATQWPTAFDVFDLSYTKGRKFYFLQDYEIWDSDIKKVDEALFLDLFKITISNFNKEFFKENFNIDTHVILNGIDYTLYNAPLKKFNKKETVISFIEHHLDSKGVNNAVEVVKRLHKNYGDLKFICFGQHNYHNIPDFVTFFQNLSDVDVAKNIYGNTDIFVYPSLKEGFALPPAEAMACKCAVVTTTVGAIPEYSIHGKNAIHVPPGDVDKMYFAIEELLQNREHVKELAESAYVDIRNKLDWNTSVSEMEYLFLENI